MSARSAWGRLRDDDSGTIVPMILLFFLVAAFVVMAGSATSSAFLAQRDLQGVCDAAAVKAANAVDGGSLYGSGALTQLPLSAASVQASVEGFRTQDYAGDTQGLTMLATTDGRTATVTCRRTVRIPFGAFFGHAQGLDRAAESTARAPVRD